MVDMTKKEKAVDLYSKGFLCSQSVLGLLYSKYEKVEPISRESTNVVAKAVDILEEILYSKSK